MPCYLFTFHAYASWMPDRRRGYVVRKQGILPQNENRAKVYRQRARERQAVFDETIQRAMLEEFPIACEKQRLRGHFMATESTHVHLLVSWPDERDWSIIRSGLKQSLTRHLRRTIAKRTWFSDGASRKRVLDREHFGYLAGEYLPSHRGWKWREGSGVFH